VTRFVRKLAPLTAKLIKLSHYWREKLNVVKRLEIQGWDSPIDPTFATTSKETTGAEKSLRQFLDRRRRSVILD
jgi:hypothetical protein